MKANSVFIGLGTNLGNRKQNLKKALIELKTFIKITHKSSVYESKPVGYKNQPDFLNMVIEGQTTLAPRKLLASLQKVEKKLGRKKTFKNGPRIIDLDILFYEHTILRQHDLIIPHPEIPNRAFVLIPLAEIAAKKQPWIKKRSKN